MRFAFILSGLSSVFMATSVLAVEPGDRTRIVLSADQSAPWVPGASAQARRQATELFDEGTRLATMGHVAPATDVFRKALKQWDHPTIHLELAKVLVRGDRTAEALVEAWASLRYSSALSRAHIDEATRMATTLLDTKLAQVVVRSDEEGVNVMLGSEVVLRGPGVWQGVVKPGTHQISAQRPGENAVVLTSRTVSVGSRSEISVSGGKKLVAAVAERRASDADLRAMQRQLVGFEVASTTPAPSLVMNDSKPLGGRQPMPPRIAAICANAKGETAIVCTEYAALHERVQREQEAARKRLDEMTRGGIVDVLR